MEALDVLVLAAGRGERLNGQPKAFLRLAGETLIERMAGLGRELSPSVIVAVPPDDLNTAKRLLGGRARVIAGGSTLWASFRLGVKAATAPKIVLLDVAHPLVSLELCRRVIAAAGYDDAAAAVGRPHDQAIGPDGSVIADNTPVYLLQKPIVFQLAALTRGIAAAGARSGEAADQTGVLELLRLGGVKVHLVESEPWNVKLTTQQDWRLITVLADQLAALGAPS